MDKVFKNIAEQGIGQNAARYQQILEQAYQAKLAAQDICLSDAMAYIEAIRFFVQHPEHILGSDRTKHGEIFEWMQVCFCNSRNRVNNLSADYRMNPDRFARDDLFYKNIPVQCKNFNGAKATFNAIVKHFTKYPEALEEGSLILVPKDRYEEIMKILTTKPSLLSRSQYTLLKEIRGFEKATGFQFAKDVKPGIVSSDQTHICVAEITINDEEKTILKMDKKLRDKFFRETRPNLGDFVKAAAAGAVIEGSMTFIICVIQKRRNNREWSDIWIDTGLSFIKGAVRGGGVYFLTSFTAIPAPMATALFTAIFGITGQAKLYVNGKISADEFAVNANQICLETAVSAGFSALGQALIPVPVVGALIGNAAGMFFHELFKSHAARFEESAINQRQEMINALDRELEQTYTLYALTMQFSAMQFSALIESANTDAGIVKLATYAGVPSEKLILNEADAHMVFMC